MVISMAREPSDVLAALWLTRRARAPLRLAPLFETLADLRAAPATMERLYATPTYRDVLRGHGDRQLVMLGYSDSGKDSGFVASQWALHVAQEQLAAQAAAAGLELELFHGRGGSPSRGGGRMHRAILAQPPGSIGGRIRITEQGETVSARYGDPELAVRSLEQTLSAVLLASWHEQAPVAPEWRAELERLAEDSRRRYRALVYDDPDFPRFFEQITPLAELTALNIGSRPSRRAAGGIEELRAIPWVFAWTQNRLLLPSWYGAGAALAAGALELQQAMAAGWPFFRSLLSTLEMALYKTDLGVAERYLRLVEPGLRERFWPGIAREHDQVVGRLLAITGATSLLDDSPALQRRLSHRNPWIDPLSHLQVELLARSRADQAEAREPLLATITGIAAGMRNTG
jgi:phosphoenolpyruvate carboxylase